MKQYSTWDKLFSEEFKQNQFQVTFFCQNHGWLGNFSRILQKSYFWRSIQKFESFSSVNSKFYRKQVLSWFELLLGIIEKNLGKNVLTIGEEATFCNLRPPVFYFPRIFFRIVADHHSTVRGIWDIFGKLLFYVAMFFSWVQFIQCVFENHGIHLWSWMKLWIIMNESSMGFCNGSRYGSCTAIHEVPTWVVNSMS